MVQGLETIDSRLLTSKEAYGIFCATAHVTVWATPLRRQLTLSASLQTTPVDHYPHPTFIGALPLDLIKR